MKIANQDLINDLKENFTFSFDEKRNEIFFNSELKNGCYLQVGYYLNIINGVGYWILCDESTHDEYSNKTYKQVEAILLMQLRHKKNATKKQNLADAVLSNQTEAEATKTEVAVNYLNKKNVMDYDFYNLLVEYMNRGGLIGKYKIIDLDYDPKNVYITVLHKRHKYTTVIFSDGYDYDLKDCFSNTPASYSEDVHKNIYNIYISKSFKDKIHGFRRL